MMTKLVHLFLPHHSNNHRPKILHTRSLFILTGLLIATQALAGLFSSIKPQILGYAAQIPTAKIIDLTNTERAKFQLPPLKLNEQLSDAARRKAADMFASNYWAHVSPNGTQPWSFILAAGYNYLHAGENLARDFTNPESIVQAWMDSPSHRENILNSRYQDIGVAVVDGNLTGSDTTLVVQMFGTLQKNKPEVAPQSASIIKPVLAASDQNIEPTPTLTPTPTPQTNLPTPQPTYIVPSVFTPATISKVIAIAFALMLGIVLAIDWLVAWQKNLVRLSGKNWAHITYLAMIIITALILKSGFIL